MVDCRYCRHATLRFDKDCSVTGCICKAMKKPFVLSPYQMEMMQPVACRNYEKSRGQYPCNAQHREKQRKAEMLLEAYGV